MSEEQQKNIFNAEKTPRRGRITWKEAFYLLKRVALHRFRLKHFPEPESKPREREQQPQIAPLPPPLPTHTEAGERIIYPRRTLDQARKNYLTIIYLNDQANLRPLDRNVGSELKVDDLAKSILNGILNEIRSRSGSSSSASHHEAPAVIKPKTIDGYDLDEKGQRTNNRDDEYQQTSRNEQRIKYVVDRQPPTLSIRSLLADELGTGKILTSKPSIVLGQEESKRPSKGTKEPLQKQDLSIDVFASDSNVFEPYRSLVDRKPLIKKPESEHVPKVRPEPEFLARKPDKDYHIPTIRKPVDKEERREKVFVSLPTPRSTNEVKVEHRKEPPKKPAHEEPPTPRDDDKKRETRDVFKPKRGKEEEEEKYASNLEEQIRRPTRDKRETFKPKIVRGEKDEKEKFDEDKQRPTRFVIKPKPIEKPKEPSGDKPSSFQGDKPSISRRKVPGKSDDKKSPIRKVPQPDKKGQPKKPTERDHRTQTEEGQEEPENEVDDENMDDNEMKLTLPFVDESKAFTEPSDLIEETHAKDENEDEDEGEGYGEDEGEGEGELEEVEELEDSGDKDNLKGEIVSDIVDDVLDQVSKLIERPVVERVEDIGDNLSDRVQIKTPFQSLEDEVVLKDIDRDKDKETDRERQKEERYTDVTSPLEEEEEDAIKETEQSPVPEDDSKELSQISESKDIKKPLDEDELEEQPEDLEDFEKEKEDVEKMDEEVDRKEVGENEEKTNEDAKDESEVESEPEIKELIKDEKDDEIDEKPPPTSPKSSKSSKESKKGSLIPRVYSPILFGTKKKVGKDEESESSEESEEEGGDKPKSTEPTESPTKIGLESVLDEETTKQEEEIEGEGEGEEDEEGVSTIKKGTEFRPLLESPKSESSEHESLADLTNPDEDEIKDETLDQEAVPDEDVENADVSEIDRIERQQPVEDQSQPIVPSRPQTNLAKKKREKEKPEIDEAFFYDYNALVFKPVISEESNLSEDLLQLYNSFGYDCNKRSNLYLIDPETLMFSAGNLVVMLNIKTKAQKYLRTLSGGAVGAIAVHPSRRFFAVGEKGNLPNINIYEYPSLKLYRILRNGTIRGYAHLDFDPTGNLLASLGTAPDFMLTIWDWRQEKIVLRTKAFSQDVFKVTFSKDLTGILTSAGTGHIKFWKMAHTFTGFKLQGDLGKFGKTEISDIEGYAELPDGKVLSGSEWGNMLLWDGGLIQTEICCKKNKPCHVGPIQQIILNESDVYTIGTDGWVRVWDFETIDTSEPSEEGVKLELEPINELKVGTNVSLRSMVKDELYNEESSIWYAQDSNGGIWRLDLSFSAASESPKQLFSYHSGSINGIETCSLAHLFVTTADDGSVRVVDYANGVVVAQRKFNSPGTCIKWLSTSVDPEGGTIAVGFNDGVLRFLKLVPKNEQQFELVLIEAFKPHTKAIRAIAVDSKSSIIATGSDDPSVFFFSNKKNVRVPIGFVNLPSPVTYMTWTPADYESNRLLVCMKDGSVYEFEAPVEGKYDTSKSYLIEMSLKSRKYTFKSIKSRLRHEEEMERKRIEEEERKKKEEEERRLRGVDEEEEKAKAAKKGKKGQQKKESKVSEEQQTATGETPAAEGEGGGSGEGSNEEQGAKKDEPAPEEAPPAAAPEDEWKPYIPEVPSKIHWAVYSSPNTFWLSMDDYDAGYLYECRFLDEANKAKLANSDKIDEPFRAVPVTRSDITHSEDIPLSSIVFNNKKTYCAIGEKNGVVRISPMPESKQLEDVKHYWSYGFHDCDYGHITQMCFSYDEKFLFSVGADSNIFGILFNATLDDLERARTQKIRLACQTQVKNVTDIDDPMAYSIEQAKLKSESDKTIANAEAKKQDMRDKIGDLRRAFKELLDKNDQLVPRLRLEKNDFQIEDSIKDHVYQQVQSKVDLTYRELAWQSEKCRLLLDKLKTRFKDVIECDHIVVYTFQQAESIFVSSFRTVTLPKDMEQYKSELEKQYFAKMLEKQKNKENIDNLEKEIRLKLYGIRKPSVDLIMNELEQKLSDAKSDVTDLIIDQLSATESGGNEDQLLIPPGLSATDQMKRIFGRLRGNTAAKVERALKKMEEKKMKRLRRKKEWKDLMDSRLPDDYENPEDVASIKYAQDNLGDFKLKSSDDYVVPENQRMNVFRAVERLMLIKEFIHKNQMIFNKKLLSLRNKKMNLIEEINSSIDRLQQISYLLGQSKSSENRLTRLELRPEEIPEKKYEYTRDKLIEFKKEMEIKASKAAEDEAQSSSVGGLGGFSAAAAAPTQTAASSAKKQADAPLSNETKSTSSIYEGLKPIWQNRETMSPLMTQIVQAKEIRLMYEQKELYKSIEEKTMLFDAELKALRHERARIAIFMKNADLRHVTIYEEFMLLREFEKTENELEMKLTKKKEEFLEMQTKLADAQLKIDNKRKDLEKLDENYKQLAHTFSHMIHDETKYNDFLARVYKRKIKRKKKVEGQEEDEESEEESIESDSDDEDFDEEDEDSDGEGKEQLDLDICPSGLKQELFDQVCQLREKRLDLDEQIAEEKRTLEQLKKDQDTLVKKAKLVENSLKQAQHELENFQREKQKKINNLDIVVMLRLNQIEYLKDGRLPSDLSASLAFDSRDLERLQRRIKELQVEKAAEKKLFKSLKERHTNLIRDKKKMDEYVEKLDEVCNKMMVDRFGKLVDVEKLELIAVNQQIEELKQRLAENEFDHEKVIQDWLNKISVEKDEEIELIKANTSRINEMIDIMSGTKGTETRLDAKQTSLGEELAGTNKKEIEERQRLHTLVQLQAQEVEALKAEISILSRKGGHILPPTQPPMSQIQT